jgi:hypothetical protein
MLNIQPVSEDMFLMSEKKIYKLTLFINNEWD